MDNMMFVYGTLRRMVNGLMSWKPVTKRKGGADVGYHFTTAKNKSKSNEEE
jgi:hypothetical protein